MGYWRGRARPGRDVGSKHIRSFCAHAEKIFLPEHQLTAGGLRHRLQELKESPETRWPYPSGIKIHGLRDQGKSPSIPQLEFRVSTRFLQPPVDFTNSPPPPPQSVKICVQGTRMRKMSPCRMSQERLYLVFTEPTANPSSQLCKVHPALEDQAIQPAHHSCLNCKGWSSAHARH